MFGVAALTAIIFGAVPTWQNHGPEAGPGLVARSKEPGIYYGLTAIYCVTALASVFLAFYRFPWVNQGHIRFVFLAVFLLLVLQLLWFVTR